MNEILPQVSTKGIDGSTLKLIAIVGMTLDHIGIVFGNYIPLSAEIFLYAFGGLTFPIMAFLMVEGHKNTSNLWRYWQRLLVFAGISTLPYMWATQSRGLNVMFTLFLGLITLYLYDQMQNRLLFWFVFAGLTLVTIFMDWSLMGVPMVLLYYTRKGKWSRLIVPVLIPIAMMLLSFFVAYTNPYMSAVETLPGVAFALVGCSLTVPLLAKYNGQRGPAPKYLFYAYYPGHLLVLALLRGLLFQEWWF